MAQNFRLYHSLLGTVEPLLVVIAGTPNILRIYGWEPKKHILRYKTHANYALTLYAL